MSKIIQILDKTKDPLSKLLAISNWSAIPLAVNRVKKRKKTYLDCDLAVEVVVVVDTVHIDDP